MQYYQELLEKLGNRESKKIGNNTYLIKLRVNNELTGPVVGVAIKYHQTKIVSIYQDGHVFLNTGGWNTVTTQQRINKALREMFRGTYLISKRKQDMIFLQTSRGVYEFGSTISLDKNGHISKEYWSTREEA